MIDSQFIFQTSILSVLQLPATSGLQKDHHFQSKCKLKVLHFMNMFLELRKDEFYSAVCTKFMQSII